MSATAITPILVFLGATVGLVVLIVATVLLIVPIFKGIGWCFRAIGWFIAHIARFIGRTVADVLRAIGSVIAAIVFIPLTLLNIVIGRWSAAGHFARALNDELGSAASALYRLFVGNPARLLLLDGALEGIEQRVPNAIAHAPGSDRPSRRSGQFPGYTITGSLKGGGSGGRLFIAEPTQEKHAAFARVGVPSVDAVVIKSFSIEDGSTLPQIIRESRALEAARNLNLILDHELTNERFYYVTPYVPGIDLTTETQRLHSRSGPQGLDPEPLRLAISYVQDLLATLDRYHRGGLWHKDIKPDNIIVADAEAHLVDLGLVTPLRSAMTLTTHGTEYFRDPELVRLALRGVKVHEVDGVKFDLYGAGAVLYSILENSFPAHAGLSRITKRCPEALRWIVRRAMADINQRYASANEMLADLREVARANDPYSLRPADLPSVRAGFQSSPDIEEDQTEGAASHHSFAPQSETPRAGTPIPGSPVSPTPATPVPARRPALSVTDWWTGRYRSEVVQNVSRPQQTAQGGKVRSAHSPSPRARSVSPVGPRPSAKEQLGSARERVRSMRTRAHERMRRNRQKLRARERTGIAIAVGGFLIFVVLVLPAILRTYRPAPAGPTQPYTFRVHPIALSDSEGDQVLRADFPADFDTISAYIRDILHDPSPDAGLVLVLDTNAAPPSEQLRAVTGDLGRPVIYASGKNSGDYVSDTFVAEALAILGVNRDPDVDTSDRLIELLQGTSDPRVTDLIWYSNSAGGPLVQQYGSTEPVTIHLVTLRDLRAYALMQPIYGSSRTNTLHNAIRSIRPPKEFGSGNR